MKNYKTLDYFNSNDLGNPNNWIALDKPEKLPDVVAFMLVNSCGNIPFYMKDGKFDTDITMRKRREEWEAEGWEKVMLAEFNLSHNDSNMLVKFDWDNTNPDEPELKGAYVVGYSFHYC